eukprot:TRINITY_DN1569_c0_g1_i2.p1 TRINITY_DN1569_c0_g1~~TRINITY_DN1569_c0_g1_i2.p1  ORF type:complete len:110 (-),score=1.97 TRINITY_DN1569_c0_g1_i2:94-423(-)
MVFELKRHQRNLRVLCQSCAWSNQAHLPASCRTSTSSAAIAVLRCGDRDCQKVICAVNIEHVEFLLRFGIQIDLLVEIAIEEVTIPLHTHVVLAPVSYTHLTLPTKRIV